MDGQIYTCIDTKGRQQKPLARPNPPPPQKKHHTHHTLPAGESLLNDGSALVLFTLARGMVVSQHVPTPLEAVQAVARLALIGPVVGLAVGALASYVRVCVCGYGWVCVCVLLRHTNAPPPHPHPHTYNPPDTQPQQ